MDTRINPPPERDEIQDMKNFIDKLKRYCHVKNYFLGSIPERYTWNCYYTSQRADDECAQVYMTFTYSTYKGQFVSIANITRVFFVGGEYDFELKILYEKDISMEGLIDFFICVDKYVEVPFGRLEPNEFLTFQYEVNQLEQYNMREIVECIKKNIELPWEFNWNEEQKLGCLKYERKYWYRSNFYGINVNIIFDYYTGYGFKVNGYVDLFFDEDTRERGTKFKIEIKNKKISTIKRAENWLKGYLYPLCKLKPGSSIQTKEKILKRIKTIEEILKDVHAPNQPSQEEKGVGEGEGEGEGEGGKGGTASQMTTVASILETIHERVLKLEVIH